ncbi:hypothetical protein Tco_0087295 [Tanacetum coccineum]
MTPHQSLTHQNVNRCGEKEMDEVLKRVNYHQAHMRRVSIESHDVSSSKIVKEGSTSSHYPYLENGDVFLDKGERTKHGKRLKERVIPREKHISDHIKWVHELHTIRNSIDGIDFSEACKIDDQERESEQETFVMRTMSFDQWLDNTHGDHEMIDEHTRKERYMDGIVPSRGEVQRSGTPNYLMTSNNFYFVASFIPRY